VVEAVEDSVRVLNIMIRDVITVGENDMLSEVAAKLAEKQISGAPVVDEEGQLIGIISDGDILRYMNTYDPKQDKTCSLDSTNAYKVCMQRFGVYTVEPAKAVDLFATFEKASRKKVKNVMIRDVITASPMDDIETVSAMMIYKNIKRIPIVRDGRVVGIVSRADIVKYVSGKMRAKELIKKT
jgi:CBS domain-containing protein